MLNVDRLNLSSGLWRRHIAPSSLFQAKSRNRVRLANGRIEQDHAQLRHMAICHTFPSCSVGAVSGDQGFIV
jgi:hypothetical protein